MKIIKDEQRYNDELGMSYRHVEAKHNGHTVEVNIDHRGYHVRLDQDNMKIAPNLDEWGVVKLISALLGGKTRS